MRLVSPELRDSRLNPSAAPVPEKTRGSTVLGAQAAAAGGGRHSSASTLEWRVRQPPSRWIYRHRACPRRPVPIGDFTAIGGGQSRSLSRTSAPEQQP